MRVSRRRGCQLVQCQFERASMAKEPYPHGRDDCHSPGGAFDVAMATSGRQDGRKALLVGMTIKAVAL